MDTLEAVRRAYQAHKKRLFTIAVALTGDRAAAEDVVHDVFAQLIQSTSWPRGDNSLAKYLVVCARNRALDWLRARRRHRSELVDLRELRSQEADPAEAAARQQELEAALEAVAHLPEDLRDVLVLRIWGGLPFRRIAELQAIGKSAAHDRYERALEEVAKLLTGRSTQ